MRDKQSVLIFSKTLNFTVGPFLKTILTVTTCAINYTVVIWHRGYTHTYKCNNPSSAIIHVGFIAISTEWFATKACVPAAVTYTADVPRTHRFRNIRMAREKHKTEIISRITISRFFFFSLFIHESDRICGWLFRHTLNSLLTVTTIHQPTVILLIQI